VFVNAVSAVRRVAALLKLLGLPAVALHAQQQQRQRLKALDRFKSHEHGVLVATDVAARGLDIPNVQVCAVADQQQLRQQQWSTTSNSVCRSSASVVITAY
jgi:superfamily II DNA/RNA helicase